MMIMRKATSPRSRFALCIDNDGYAASLEVHKVCRVLPDAQARRDGDLRVVDESGEDYLYPARMFILLDLPPKAKRALARSRV